MLFLLFTVGFLAAHPNGGSHFAALGEVLQENGISYVAYGADQSRAKMEGRIEFVDISEEIPLSQLDEAKLKDKANSLAHQISKEADLLLVDVGTPFSKYVVEALKAKNVEVWPYYDNFEAMPPGDYGIISKEIIQLAGRALYASAKLSDEFGIGYYPLEEMDEIYALKGAKEKKNSFFEKHHLDPSLPLMVFLGGASDVYADAFSTFVEAIGVGIPGWNILLQRHPRAEEEGIRDALMIQGGPITLSTSPFNEVLAYADMVGYYQTTAAFRSILLGTPTFEWGGFSDCFVYTGLIPQINHRIELERFLNSPYCPLPNVGLKLVGFSEDWRERWLRFVELLRLLVEEEKSL